MQNQPQSVFDSIISIDDIIVNILDVSLICPIETPSQIIGAITYLNSAISSLLEEALPLHTPNVTPTLRSMPHYIDPLTSGDDYI